MNRTTSDFDVLKSGIIVLAIMAAFFLFTKNGFAQLSPGELAESHSHLEGLSNCTECHILGEKVSKNKCLACHRDLKLLIDQKKGYHSSKEISGKECITCHSDHHGKKFEMIRFDKEEFDHTLTGYELLGAHKEKKCEDCHKVDFITSEEIKKKNFTYLGLGTDCLSCHNDYHQNTLSNDCKQCHDYKVFKPASGFDHKNTKFQLVGKHKDVVCTECHKIATVNGKQFQEFAGITFASCTSCHKDVHDNKFGQNCTKCHNEQSFNIITGLDSFDHSKTRFNLENKHRFLKCKDCHKTKLTDPVAHSRCTDCHTDYHENQFVKPGNSPDCSDCHTTRGFTGSSFTIERHKEIEFPLLGAHLATPCFVCHKTEEKWNFRNIGKQCVDCHKNIHESFISEKYYPQANCRNCHTENNWLEVNFDHSKTGYSLLGSHSKQSCRACHFKILPNGVSTQQFARLTSACTDCHDDKHYAQFETNGVTDCFKCHDYNNWKADKFDHNNTRFALDGKHKNVACSACHKEKQVGQTTFIQYKLNGIKCENCH